MRPGPDSRRTHAPRKVTDGCARCRPRPPSDAIPYLVRFFPAHGARNKTSFKLGWPRRSGNAMRPRSCAAPTPPKFSPPRLLARNPVRSAGFPPRYLRRTGPIAHVLRAPPHGVPRARVLALWARAAELSCRTPLRYGHRTRIRTLREEFPLGSQRDCAGARAPRPSRLQSGGYVFVFSPIYPSSSRPVRGAAGYILCALCPP